MWRKDAETLLFRVDKIDLRLRALQRARQQALLLSSSHGQKELLRVIDSALADGNAIKSFGIEAINSMDDPLYSAILRVRYLDGLTLEKTAEGIHYSYYHCSHVLIPRAIAALQKTLDRKEGNRAVDRKENESDSGACN